MLSFPYCSTSWLLTNWKINKFYGLGGGKRSTMAMSRKPWWLSVSLIFYFWIILIDILEFSKSIQTISMAQVMYYGLMKCVASSREESYGVLL